MVGWIIFLLSFLLSYLIFFLPTATGGGGKWQLLHKSIGITAMHMQLLNNDRVVIYDRTDFGLSNISLPAGRCRNDTLDMNAKFDCTAHSVEYDVVSNSVRPLMVKTDVWCSSGAVAPDGNLIQTGGFNDGDRVVRIFQPCVTCDWQEIGFGLLARRWYATNQILPNGRSIIIGGRRQFNYEFFPKSPGTNSLVMLPFLRETNDYKQENNLYPFVHLNVDGNLFIYANNRAVLLDYTKNLVLRTYPSMPGRHPRNYPSTGSSVLLPLITTSAGAALEAEVMICGGAPRGSYKEVSKGRFLRALNSCGRMKITDLMPNWRMETMPSGRAMGDMILLPNGEVLIINGAGAGTAGWDYGREPVLNPVLYKPYNPVGSRFEVQNPTTIPRLYHSAAILLRDGRVLVGGNNPHIYYNFTNVLFPTDLSLEAFSPSYLNPKFSRLRPIIQSPKLQAQVNYGQPLVVRFLIPGVLSNSGVFVTMVAPSFTTHSFSMNQRLLVLGNRGGEKPIKVAKWTYQVEVTTPRSGLLAPSGYYILFVIHQNIPSAGVWVQIQ